jgi:hypothetical protein
MYTITEEQYKAKPKDYKGVWSSDDFRGTNFNGRRTLMVWLNGTCLLIEGESLTIVKTEQENINPIKK